MNGDPPADNAAANTIELVLPARTEFAATLGVLAASLGADLGFSVDEIDDLRLALDEVFTAAADNDQPDRMSVSFRPGAGRIEVMAFVLGADTFDFDERALDTIRSAVDDVTITEQTITFSKGARDAVG